MTKEIKTNELEKVSGGNFLPNSYSKAEYAECGIIVIDHIIELDDFYWKGIKVWFYEADAIVRFVKENGRQPDTVDEAYWYCKCSSGHSRRRK